MSGDGTIKVVVEMREGAPWLSIHDSRQIGRVDCQECNLSISGAGSRLRVTGDCPFVDVSGSGNDIELEAAGSISVSGDNNDVQWLRGLDGDGAESAPTATATCREKVVTRNSGPQRSSCRSDRIASDLAPLRVPRLSIELKLTRLNGLSHALARSKTARRMRHSE